MSGKSIDKDHIRLSLSGLATEHPRGDVNYLCFTTKTPGRAKQPLQCCKKLLMQSPGCIEKVFAGKLAATKQTGGLHGRTRGSY